MLATLSRRNEPRTFDATRNVNAVTSPAMPPGMAFTGAQTALRTATGGAEQGLFSSRSTGPFSPPAVERTQYGFNHASAPPEPLPRIDNIMNRRADMNSSLYQICLTLKRRLAEVPGFDRYILEMEQDERDGNDSTDPVTSMWNLLRRGFPLMDIYNALKPRVPLVVNHSRVTEAKLGKAATFKFLQACLEELKFPANECFLITDLYGSDTTGFVKVTKVVNRVLDILSERGLLLRSEPKHNNDRDEEPQKRSHKQNVIDELVTSERDYVQHLETLQQFKNQVEQTGAIPGDAVHDIFLNLNALLDFQRRFLIRIEQQNSLDEASQNWGQLFVQYQDSFKVYEPFIANQKRCTAIVCESWAKLKMAAVSPAVQGMVATESVLLGFLMKPFQRLTKYPMLLSDLRKKGGLEEEKQHDLLEGETAASSVLVRANEAIAREERQVAVDELLGRVDDWKGHDITHFGELLLYGSHTVLKGDGQKEVEREYNVYLFEHILLCCKEINPNKPKNRLGNNKSLVDKKGKPRLQLKGRIFMQNVTDVVSFSKHGSYFIQIFWKGDPGVENFVIRFVNEETMNKWRSKVEAQRVALSDSARSSGQTGTSETEFLYIKNQAALQNPYKQEYDGEEEEEQAAKPSIFAGGLSEFNMSRNTSSTSLRSRSTTGGSGPSPGQGASRAAPPRFPIPEHVHGSNVPPLTLSTNFTSGSPLVDEHHGDSYFSPMADSPVSTRSSTQTNMFPFPRQQVPNLGWTAEEHKHNTAPAIGRTPSRDGQTPVNTYTMNGRTVLRPSLPAMAASQTVHQLSLTQSRSRSASTPDIHNPNSLAARRYANGQPPVDIVPVPPIPAHMSAMRAPINRSQTNSPTGTQMPLRTGNQSPQLPRDRGPVSSHAQYSYDKSQQSVQRSETRPHPSLTSGGLSGLGQRQVNPSFAQSPGNEKMPSVTQLKVKIYFDPEPSHVTIIVPIIIKHRSLIDRIDSKMERVSSLSIAKGTAKLRYCDSDNEMVTMGCDEDVGEAIAEWTKLHRDELNAGIVPDIELFWSKA